MPLRRKRRRPTGRRYPCGSAPTLLSWNAARSAPPLPRCRGQGERFSLLRRGRVAVTVLVELLGLGRARHRRGRRLAGRDRGGDRIEVARAHFALVLDRGVAVLLGRELGFLQLRVRSHAAVLVAARQLEHTVIERV